MKTKGLWKDIFKYDKELNFSDLNDWNGTNGYRARKNAKKAYRKNIKSKDKRFARKYIRKEVEKYLNSMSE